MGKTMPKTISFSWPGLDNDVNDKKNGFLFSFEVKVSTLTGFILIMMQFLAGQLKFQYLSFFQQFLVGPVPLVPGRQRWQGAARTHHDAFLMHSVCTMVQPLPT